MLKGPLFIVLANSMIQNNLDIPVTDLEGFVDFLGQGGHASVYESVWKGAGGGQVVAIKEVVITA